MTKLTELLKKESDTSRQKFVIGSFLKNYQALIKNDPSAWRSKFRKMATSPFNFYRGSAALYYADVSRDDDPFLNEKTSRVWIQGDLHAENFGTYMNGAGILVFDVNDFDEAYVGPFTWDMKRLVASLALIGYQKAMSDSEIREVIASAARGYSRQISKFASGETKKFALTLENTKGKLLGVLHTARLLTRVDLLNDNTEIVNYDRRFKLGKSILPVSDEKKAQIMGALEAYYKSIKSGKKNKNFGFAVKDISRRKGLGVGSAGLPIYSILIEGESQSLENDLIISMKEAQPSAVAQYITDENVGKYFLHNGHRTATSQRALQAFADPFLGHTTLDGKGMFVTEVSPYGADLEWDDINDLDDMLEVTDYLGQCVAKIHCCSDDDSDQSLINYSIEDAINAVLNGKEADFINYMVDFGENYAAQVRKDHALFVDAFRNRLIEGI
ncbi:MAG: DUF2252 domain-containing protein [Cytophagales bacterium]|nr:MAG: DUF2252 domain-containing protein [Cytophagales bacterium]TAF60018.1 MAG: DUF2252 domain-containing protein [Cytophagales bacterium]